jgi:cysteine synthase A
MFRLGVRTFTTTARRAAETVAQMEAPNQYGIGVSKAQGVVKGLTGGLRPSTLPSIVILTDDSNWKHPFNPLEPHFRRNRM